MIYLVSRNKSLFGSERYKQVPFEEAIALLLPLHLVQFDTETKGLDAHTKELLTVQLGCREFQVVFDWTTMSKEEFATFMNAETAKIAKSGTYDLVRKSTYTRSINIGGATDPINAIIKAIDENSSIDSVIGSFLGMGTTQGKIPKDDINANYKIKATSVRESDLGSFNASNGVYTFTLANASDPKKTNATALSRFTNDFITHEEVDAGIKDTAGSLITLKETNVKYSNIKATVKVVDGKIAEITYQYDFAATLSLKILVGNVNGSGSAKTTGAFTNIAY